VGRALGISAGLSAGRSRVGGIAVCPDRVGLSGADISRFAKYSGEDQVHSPQFSAIDTPPAAPDLCLMPSSAASVPRPVTVRAVPIELCQFLKFGGLTESGGAAKQAVAEGRVLVNGTRESRKRKQLAAGDTVTFEGQSIVVHVA
jgi:ribosome-associated protein